MKETMLALYFNLQRLLKAEDGQDLVEYALIVALIALGCCAGLNSLASAITNGFFADTAGVIQNAYGN